MREDAVRQAPADLVLWEAHGLPRPEWSHRDGTSLCPVIDRASGYRPAEPQPRQSEPGTQTTRLAPPATLRPSLRAAMTRQLTGSPGEPGPAAGAVSVLGREHARRILARLGDLHRVARAADPEAGG
jgi:hypothetical protein